MPLTKTQRLTVRFSPGEQQRLELAAYASGVTPSEFVRRIALACTQQILENIEEKNRA